MLSLTQEVQCHKQLSGEPVAGAAVKPVVTGKADIVAAEPMATDVADVAVGAVRLKADAAGADGPVAYRSEKVHRQ